MIYFFILLSSISIPSASLAMGGGWHYDVGSESLVNPDCRKAIEKYAKWHLKDEMNQLGANVGWVVGISRSPEAVADGNISSYSLMAFRALKDGRLDQGKMHLEWIFVTETGTNSCQVVEVIKPNTPEPHDKVFNYLRAKPQFFCFADLPWNNFFIIEIFHNAQTRQSFLKKMLRFGMSVVEDTYEITPDVSKVSSAHKYIYKIRNESKAKEQLTFTLDISKNGSFDGLYIKTLEPGASLDPKWDAPFGPVATIMESPNYILKCEVK